MNTLLTPITVSGNSKKLFASSYSIAPRVLIPTAAGELELIVGVDVELLIAALEGKTVKIGDWLPKDKAVEIVKESIERYNDNKNI